MTSLNPPTPENGYTDAQITTAPPLVVRYSSDQVICVEAIEDERWVGRYWSADGRVNVSAELWSAEAFQIEINDEPVKTGWTVLSAAEVDDSGGAGRHVVVELSNPLHSLRVKVHTRLDGTPVLARWLEITNTAARSLGLTQVAPWSGRLWPGRNFTLGYFTKDEWTSEGWFEWQPVPLHTTRLRCDKGQGHDDPFFVVRDEVSGEYFFGHLAWSANWVMEFTRDKDGLQFRVGPEAVPCQRVISPGETVTTPAVHLGHTSGSFDAMVQAMHAHLRRSVLPHIGADRSYRIQYLVPADQGYYTPFNEQSALRSVDVAAEIGAELFLLDAYWWDITPDWLPSADRFPRGLEPVIEHAHARGMLFGLYIEPEAGRGRVSDSAVYQKHPDWFGPKKVLKLTIPAAAAWTEAETRRLIEQYHLDLLRIDYNPYFTFDGSVTERDGITENNYWRYYEVFYDLFERLARDYPNLILQQCAAGGARNDLGTVSRFHETYLTDGLSLPRELQVYSGLTTGLPPEILMIVHGADGGWGTGKPQNLDTILRMTYAASMPAIFAGTVGPSVAELSPHRKARFLHYRQIYIEFIRPLLPNCKLFHHEPVNARGGVEFGPWFVMEYAAPDRSQGWALVIRMRNGPGDLFVHHYPNAEVVDDTRFPPREAVYDSTTYIFQPRGLDPAKTYQVMIDSLNIVLPMRGMELVQAGLPTRLENVGMSELYLFK